MLQVAIVSDVPAQRQSLASLVGQSSGLVLAGAYGSRAELLALGAAADVIVAGGSESLLATLARAPAPGVLVAVSDDARVRRTLERLSGGYGLLPTHTTAAELVAAIQAAVAGLAVVHPDLADGSAEGRPDSYPDPEGGESGLGSPGVEALTARERDVLSMLAAGLNNRAIAARLGISEHTAKFHVSQILAKLGAVTRAAAVSIAIRRGLIPL
jgi:two-component system, NarL family, nitrate/nitrite response regulator NarL